MYITCGGTYFHLSASGDDGVGGFQQSSNAGCSIGFAPSFPLNCPYVTAVGVTQFNVNDNAAFVLNSVSDPGETTAMYNSLDRSGGGFSSVFPQLSFQSAAVTIYNAKLNDTNTGQYNASGRVYPDALVMSLNWYTVVDGSGYALPGTSAPAPAWAGITGLINDFRIPQNKTKLG